MLVLGGTGGVGRGLAEALLARADVAKVVVAGRDRAKLDAFARERAGPRLATVHGSVDDRASAEALLAAALEHGELAAVVASLGGWWEGGALTTLEDDAWSSGLRTLLTPHFTAARTFVPALRAPGSRYLLIGGGAAVAPVPGSALVSIAGAAQLMFARALVAERAGEAIPIIEQLIISGPVKTNARHHGPPRADEMTAREAGDIAAQMLADGTTGAWPRITRDGPIVTAYPRATA